MKPITAILTLTSVLAGVVTAATTSKCNADNCARAVTGTLRAATASHFADCQSFLSCTVTPAPSTVTTTLTVTSANPSPVRRQVTAASPVTNCPSAVPTYASACSGSVRYSSACSCFGASKKTTTLPAATSTSTVTVTVTPTPTQCADPEGFQWAYYFPAGGSTGFDRTYDPATFKTLTPSVTGVTDYLAITGGQGVYGQSLDQNSFIVNHRGYIFAPETGTYSLTGTFIDDITHMWIGPIAYSGWNRDNAQQQLEFDIASGSGTFLIDLVAGNYYPFRLIYRQFGGPLGLSYAIVAPSGRTIIGADPNSAQFNSYAVQSSCDGVTAPPFQPYGQET